MLKIDAFATVHERQRRLAVEMEMPEIPQQPYVAPVPHARQEGVHQQAPDQVILKLVEFLNR